MPGQLKNGAIVYISDLETKSDKEIKEVKDLVLLTHSKLMKSFFPEAQNAKFTISN